MADEADTANEYAERELAAALASVPLPPAGIGPMYCQGLPGEPCDNKIPEARREGGYRLCVECQRVREARG